jgi:predicted nucleotidyltransferase
MNYHQTKQLRDRLKSRKESHIQHLHEEAERLTLEAVKMGARKVIIFGSVAGGNTALSSDLDLIIVIDSGLDFLDRTGAVYRQLKPRIGVDLLVYTPEEIKKMKDNPFLKHAMKTGRILYEA